MTRMEAVEVASVLVVATGQDWAPERLRLFADVLMESLSHVPASHVQGVVVKLLGEQDPQTITAARVIHVAKSIPIDRPRLGGPRDIPLGRRTNSAGLSHQGHPGQGISPGFVELPDGTYRAKYEAWAARRREEVEAGRKRKDTGVLRVLRPMFGRAIEARTKGGPRVGGTYCDVCNVNFDQPADLDCFFDWLGAAPEGVEDPVIFCRDCAPDALRKMHPEHGRAA